ncbi:MAG TPA: hypothetical protein VKR22_07580 [Acidimicrobiales bacterium]|nr:hypothetical protein [Acidimicrobiales bacterium]
MGRAFPAVASALGVVLGTAVGAAGILAPIPPPAAAATATGPPTLRLVSQAPWVGPGQTMPLRLDLGTQSRAGLTLTVTLYQPLTSRSAFAETVNGTPVGAALASTAMAAGTLPADPQGGVDVTVAVQSGDTQSGGATAPGEATTTVGGPGQLTADLHCAANSCGGVYPIRLQLSSSAGGPRAQLFTYLVYDNPPAATQKLRFAMVVPLAAPSSAFDSAGTVQSLGGNVVDRLDSLSAALAAHDTPITVVPEPATVAALAATGRGRARSVLGDLNVLAGGAGRETLAGSFVPVDPSALVAAGLSTELGDQVRRGAQVLAPLHPTGGTWVATGPVDQAALSALGAQGYRRFVVPVAALSQTSGSPLTPSRPFALGSGHQPPVAVESDAALSAHLAAGSGSGAALAAYQLLADLALVYYEQPNLDTARGVVAVPPAGWSPDPAFVHTVLAALPGDPVVSPVTLAQLFDDVRPSTGPARRLSSAAATQLPTRQIRDLRSRLSGFSSAVGQSGAVEARTLDDLLLHSEDVRLHSAQQRQWISAAGAALTGQLSQLSIRTDTIRLTSTAAKIPVTLLKQSGWVVSGRLQIAGDKVVFPPVAQQDPGTVCRDPTVQVSAGRSLFGCTATISHSTNAVYVAMRARATGDFRLSVTLVSPSGNLVLASSNLTVRSMSTSLVAIGLSLAAIAVLLLWWGRTVWRGRSPARRGAHARGAHTRGSGSRSAGAGGTPSTPAPQARFPAMP